MPEVPADGQIDPENPYNVPRFPNTGTDKLYGALIAAQAEFTTLGKDKTGQEGNRKFQYADLAQTVEMFLPILSKHGLGVIQIPGTPQKTESGNYFLPLTTRLIHESGQSVEWETQYPIPEMNIRKFGSAITYARRYSLHPILCIVSTEDDDDAQAVRDAEKKRKNGAPPKASDDGTSRVTADDL